MREIIRSNDPVLLGFAQVLLRDAGLEAVLMDQNMSVLEGSIGILQRRLMVASQDYDEARRVLTDSDLGQWMSTDEHS
jgi:Putative prokaryotic signal transducing protein